MTREIKFKQFINGKWHYWGFLEKGVFIGPANDTLSDGSIVNSQQYTGLKDKNGVEIYEGDIVKTNDKYYPINSVIYYAGVINEHDGDWDEWYAGFCLEDVDHTPLNTDCEVIGNIYENPELLK
jgi:uncharacterized phage protein (TIGR01671 family)